LIDAPRGFLRVFGFVLDDESRIAGEIAEHVTGGQARVKVVGRAGAKADEEIDGILFGRGGFGGVCKACGGNDTHDEGQD
jgi:hypothetical protein